MQSVKVTPTITNLHVIRGVAALLVVVYHAKFVLWSGGREFLKAFPLSGPGDYFLFALDMLSSCGRQCVILFFLLSALVIQYSFRKNQLSVSGFYSIRAVRIYIPYLASLLFSGLILYLVGQYSDPLSSSGAPREYTQRLATAFDTMGIISFLKALLFLRHTEFFGFNPAYWSLLHEGIFYLLFPLYNRLTSRVLLPLLFMVAAAAAFTGVAVLYYQTFFIAGLLLYEVFIDLRWELRVTPAQFWAGLALLFVLVNLAVQLTPEWIPDILAVVLYIWCVGYLLQGRPVVRVLSRLGDVSYSLYLFHVPVLMLCFAVFDKFVPGFSLYDRVYYYAGVAACLPVAYLAYRLVEKQSLVLISFIKGKYGVHRL